MCGFEKTWVTLFQTVDVPLTSYILICKLEIGKTENVVLFILQILEL